MNPAPDPADFWLDRPVFLTGATGLVGGHTAQLLLDRGARLVCLVRDHVPDAEFHRAGLAARASIVRGSLEDGPLLERILAEYEVEITIHLAAQTIVGIANRNPLSTFETNVAGTWRLLEAARRSPRHRATVFASSDKAYGDHTVLPYREDAPLQGRHPYDVSKSCADLIAQSYAHSFGLNVGITRCGNFFGGGDLNFSRIIPGTIRSLLRGQRPIIRSDGQFIRDYFYVEDGAEAYLHLAQALCERPQLAGRAWNFSYENQLSVLDIVALIQRHLQPDLPHELPPIIEGRATNEIRHQYLSAQAAREELGWRPTFAMEEGIARTIRWYKEWMERGEKVK